MLNVRNALHILIKIIDINVPGKQNSHKNEPNNPTHIFHTSTSDVLGIGNRNPAEEIYGRLVSNKSAR